MGRSGQGGARPRAVVERARASARIRMPLRESIQALVSLSWQWSWRRFHLRLGLPLPPSNLFAYPQAVKLYWVLGKGKESPIEAPPVEASSGG